MLLRQGPLHERIHAGLNPHAAPCQGGGLHMRTESSNNFSRGAPEWMRDMFEELKNMFEGLLRDADKLNLEEM
jgi:hypothetical protein